MTRVTCQMSLSLDGYAAGPEQGPAHPLGQGGERLHAWAFAPDGPHPVDADVARRLLEGNGAFIMGRRMFGGGDGPWDPAWRGWWGEQPPYHAPVFVLSHHPRKPLVMHGGTTFTFITGGLLDALAQARAVAGDGDVAIAGGAATVQQALRAGVLDELFLHIVPVLLGGGERLFDGVGDVPLQPVEVIESPVVTHVRYAVGNGARGASDLSGGGARSRDASA